MKKSDERFMRRAIELAMRGIGSTSPNPSVGAVVVKRGVVLGEGYHKKAGLPHAEIVALKKAGARAHGADLFVTLEPCGHWGRTPPCCDAIIRSKVRRVIVGSRDSNPIVNGRGIKMLKKEGITIRENVLKEECQRINPHYHKWVVSGIPYITMKVALTLDGKIALHSGESKWITNEACRRYVHQLRADVDAILIGSGTVQVDDPKLTVRMPNRRINKLAVVLDEKLVIPLSARIYKRRPEEVIIATTSHSSASARRKRANEGFRMLLCRSTGDGRIFIPHLLKQLGELNITSLLIEGGGEIYSSFMKLGIVDKVVACIAPKIIGGGGRDWLPCFSVEKLSLAPRLSNVGIKIFGDNVVIEGRL